MDELLLEQRLELANWEYELTLKLDCDGWDLYLASTGGKVS